jgi:hypothetical protein
MLAQALGEKCHSPPPDWPLPAIRDRSPRRIARLAHQLQSTFIGVALWQRNEQPALLYCFLTADGEQTFCVPLDVATAESIVDIYPDASAHEVVLHHRFGLMFQPPPVAFGPPVTWNGE